MNARAAILSLAAGYLLWSIGSFLEATSPGSARIMSWIGFIGFSVGFFTLLIKLLRYPGFQDFLDR